MLIGTRDYAHERTWTAIQWGKKSPEHPARIERRPDRRSWVAKSVATAVDSALQLRHLVHPAKLGTIGAFLVCLVIVISPQSFFRTHVANESSAPLNEPTVNLATREALHSIAEATIPGASRPLDQPAQQVEWAREAQVPSSVEESSPTSEAPQIHTTSIETPKRNLLDRDHAGEVQRRLGELGYLSVSATGVWGPRSRAALRAFKADHDLAADDSWDEATERSLFSANVELAEPFVGIWGADAAACSPQLNQEGLLPAVIDGERAWAGETVCAFEKKKRTVDGWNVVASCSNGRDRWTANIRLVVNGNRLTWTSQRGSQSYIRCERGPRIVNAL
jgi:Putative peptidoglycan binding domain